MAECESVASEHDPISRYGGKDSDEFLYFANDFQDHRQAQWFSIWLQAMPSILLPDVRTVIEFGGGRDLTRSITKNFGIDYRSVDLSDRFFPDFVSSIEEYPFSGDTVDLVCSFQCLEHNPWDQVEGLLKHLAQFTHRYLYLSLPYNGGWFSASLSVRLPKFEFSRTFCRVFDGLGGGAIDEAPLRMRPPERWHDPHWWELGRRGLPRKRFVSLVEELGFRLRSQRHNPFFPHHCFVLFEKTAA